MILPFIFTFTNERKKTNMSIPTKTDVVMWQCAWKFMKEVVIEFLKRFLLNVALTSELVSSRGFLVSLVCWIFSVLLMLWMLRVGNRSLILLVVMIGSGSKEGRILEGMVQDEDSAGLETNSGMGLRSGSTLWMVSVMELAISGKDDW